MWCSIQDVDLQATSDAMKKMPITRQHWWTKHASGFSHKAPQQWEQSIKQ
jgi:hypothetical protein